MRNPDIARAERRASDAASVGAAWSGLTIVESLLDQGSWRVWACIVITVTVTAVAGLRAWQLSKLQNDESAPT